LGHLIGPAEASTVSPIMVVTSPTAGVRSDGLAAYNVSVRQTPHCHHPGGDRFDPLPERVWLCLALDWRGFARQQFSENFAAPQIIGKKTANQRNNYQKFKIEDSLISAL
jgi:hypothetical protein